MNLYRELAYDISLQYSLQNFIEHVLKWAIMNQVRNCLIAEKKG